MSVQALTWLAERTPDVKPHLVGVLFGLCNHADQDGSAAHPSVALLAWYARKSERAIQNDLRELEHMDLIRPGDQRRVLHIPEDRRPVVYDLAMAYAPAWARPARRPEGRRGRPMKPQVENGVQSTAPGEVQYANGVQSTTKRGAVGFTQTTHEPSIEPTTTGEAPERAVEVVDDFTRNADALLRALGGPWRLSAVDRGRHTRTVAGALRSGWDPAALVAELTARPPEEFAAGALLGFRLSNLRDAPSAAPATARDLLCEAHHIRYAPTSECRSCRSERLAGDR